MTQSFILQKFVDEPDPTGFLPSLSSHCPLHRNNWKVYVEASGVSDPKRDMITQWGHLSNEKNRTEEQREVRGTRERNQESRGQLVTEKDRMTLEEGWVPWGRGREEDWIVELQFVKFTDKSWPFQQSLSVMGSAR